MPQLHRGHVFHVGGAPVLSNVPDALVHLPDGGLLIDDEGHIAWCGHWAERPPQSASATVVDHHGAFLLPGFVDTHLHFPQLHSTDSFGGGGLLEWLDRIVFPAEARFADPAFARTSAAAFCARMVAAGTTTSMVFGSQFPDAQLALFQSAAEHGLRMVLGRTIMTKGPASAMALLTSEGDAIAMTRDEIEGWHPAGNDGLQQVAVIPRFALSVTPRTLRALGELYEAYRDRGVYFTSHLSESNRGADGEVATVLREFSVARYLDVFDGRFRPGSKVGGLSLLGPRSVLAHAVHCADDELARLAQTRSSIAHCPVSQQFLGSGTMPWRRTIESGVTVAIGTDIGAGDEWFVPRVLNTCFKVHHSEIGPATATLHPAELLFIGTLAGARALDLEDRIGNFDVGKEADFVVIDPGQSGSLAERLDLRKPLGESPDAGAALLFTVLMAARESALAQTYVRGRRLSRIDS
jgi:guanine deaminase